MCVCLCGGVTLSVCSVRRGVWQHFYLCVYLSVYLGNENYTGIAARDTANSLAVLAHAVRGVAAGTSNSQTQGYILSTAQQV